MDYKLFRNMLAPYLVDHMAGIQAFKRQLADIAVEDAFDKKFLTVLNNIMSCLEANEAIKSLGMTLLDEADFFSDTSIHKATKSKYLDKILSDSDYIEHTKTFNLSIIQTYVEKIIHKQLYEINIKIEENQRSLNKLEVASGKMREEVQNQNLIQQANQVQAAHQVVRQVATNQVQASRTQPSQLIRKHQGIVQPQQQNLQSQQPVRNSQQPGQAADFSVQRSMSGQTEISATPSQIQSPHDIPAKSREIQTQATSYFLLIEMDQQQCAIPYNTIVEIIKFNKPVSEKILKIGTIPYNKLVGFTRGSVLRSVSNSPVDKKQSLGNMNATLPNQEDKRFAVITNVDSAYYILFVDYIVYTEPVEGREAGDYIKTVEGEYKIINP
ncbi:MAG: hypothetical protein HQK61_09695 [Desulfamplus sp.]|nr:hypothetical protein [Desulfamplus sp.]